MELKSPNQIFSQISLKAPAQLDPYHTQFLPVSVPELPEATLLVYPQLRFSQNSHPFIVNVTNGRSICVLLANPTRKQKTIKKDTIVASYEEVKVPPPISLNATQRINNDLLPQNYQTSEKGTRTQCLRELIKQQSWGHLTPSERAKLETLILENDPLFILSEKELSLISGHPEHIRVSDPQPCRGLRYRYPEKAKQIIADMRLTRAWRSEILLNSPTRRGSRP